MSLSNEHVTGFLFGIGVAGLGFYYYKKNQPQVDAWLKEQGIELPESPVRNYAEMKLEELVLEKERLEDLIAEREASVPPTFRSVVTEGQNETTDCNDEEIDDEEMQTTV